MHFYQVGKKKSPPLVILHGWGLSGDKYQKLAELLSSQYHVTVPDLPGFGKTKEPPKPYELADYARRVEKLLKENNLTDVNLIGHSFGGRVALKLANQSPKLVKSLVLTGTPGVEKRDLKRSAKRALYWTAAKSMKGFSFLPPVRRLKERFYSTRDIGKLDGVMKQTFLKVVKEKLDKEAVQIQQPTLLLWGLRDQMTPAKDAEKMLRIIPHSYLKMFTKVGHRLPYEKPHEFAREVVQFLN